ncbi:MAG: substrate-binding domain-containing protein [Promicromonosporaceae bacterium]|nr:substrate-binding domain-containing protein [Promicromonosporaceae bacterium]
MHRSFRGRYAGLLIAATAAAALVAGCSTSSNANSGSSSSSSSGGASAIQGSSSFNDSKLDELTTKIQAAIGSKDLSGVKIAMVTNGNSSYWNEAKAGWDKAMQWLSSKGASGQFEEPTQSTASAQVSLLETLSTQGYSGWAVSAVTSDSLTQPIASAVGKGQSVIAFDSPLPGTKAQFYIGTPNTDAGCAAGRAMTSAIGSGDVVAISGSLTAQNTQQRIQGFKNCMGSGVKVVQTLNDNQDVSSAVSQLQAAIQANPNIKGIYAVYSYDGGAAGQAVRAANKVGKITIVSDDGESDTVADVKSGLIAASVLQRPYYQGYMSAYALAADKALGESAAMALFQPYFASAGVLSTGVGVMTKANESDFTAFWSKIGLKSQ